MDRVAMQNVNYCLLYAEYPHYSHLRVGIEFPYTGIYIIIDIFFLYVLTGSRIKGGVAKKQQQNLHISVNPQNSSLNKQQTFNVCSMVFICTFFFPTATSNGTSQR